MKPVVSKFWVILFILFFNGWTLNGQILTDSLYENYEWRIEQPFLYDVYIPANEEEAFSEIQRLAEGPGLEKFKSAPEDSIRRRLHFGIGKWMMKNWQLMEGSRLSNHLSQKGLTYPDDMVEYLIVSFHRHLNGRERKEEALIDFYLQERKRLYYEQQEKLKKVVIDTLEQE